MLKRIAILGSTGSIGTQALEVIKEHPDIFTVEILSAQNNASLLIRQAQEFKPNTVVIGNEQHYKAVFEALDPFDIKVFAGREALIQVTEMSCFDVILIALVGYAAVQPTLGAIEAGKTIAMANKETFAVAGELVTQKAKEKHARILPVDSEHSAIFQSLQGEEQNKIEKIYLTASGGPFRLWPKEQIAKATKEDALKHPNWNMGCKITIDSASLMNKGLEVIEARWLFDLQANQIDVIVHPESIIHSMVQFTDGSIKAQMGLPDMRLPIEYALSYPKRRQNTLQRFNFADYPNLSFDLPRREVFRNLDLAYQAMNKGGNMPCILNAANEIAVNAFMTDKLGFLDMSPFIENAMNTIDFIQHPSYDDLVETDHFTREKTNDWIKMFKKSIL
ncbi:MAG: 1-deoxy-D-xylulose-5-phosphate reductoisomerase [Bacteroidota bacterium]